MPGVFSEKRIKHLRTVVLPSLLLSLSVLLTGYLCPAAAEDEQQVILQYAYGQNEMYVDIRNQTTAPIYTGNVCVSVTSAWNNETETTVYSLNSSGWILPGCRYCAAASCGYDENAEVSVYYSEEPNEDDPGSGCQYTQESEARIQRENGLLKHILIECVNPSMDYDYGPTVTIVLYNDQDLPVYAEEIRIMDDNIDMCPPLSHVWFQWDPFSSWNENKAYLYSIQDQVSSARSFSRWNPYGEFKYRILKDGTAEITEITCQYVNLTIPVVIDGHPVSSIAENVLTNSFGIHHIAIPEGIRSIRDRAFEYCSELDSVYLPSTLETIGVNPFHSCPYLKTIAFHHENARYSVINGLLADRSEQRLISYPAGLEETVCQIPPEIRSIGAYAFADCSDLTQVIFPDQLTEIGNYAFTNCALTTVTLPEALRSLGHNPFYNCYNLEAFIQEKENGEVILRNGVLFSEKGGRLVCYPAFLENSEYTIPEGTTAIGDSAFYSESNLISISIPDTVVSIGSYAFCQCEKLANIELPDSILSIGESAFQSCGKLSRIHIPAGVTEIPYLAFSNCGTLSEVSLPEGLQVIEDGAFQCCAMLSHLSLPASVTKIIDTPFYECENLSVTVVKDSYAESYCYRNKIPISETILPAGYVAPTEEPLPDWLLEDDASSAEEAEAVPSGESGSLSTEEPLPDWLMEDNAP